MSRVIIPEEPEKTQNNTEIEEHNSEANAIIKAEEIEEIFNPNIDNLKADFSLVDKMTQYIDYQKQMQKLREDLAEVMLKPYYIENSSNYGYIFNIIINGTNMARLPVYVANDIYCKMLRQDFARLLCAMGHEYGAYIKKSGMAFDAELFVLSNGGTWFVDTSSKTVEITI